MCVCVCRKELEMMEHKNLNTLLLRTCHTSVYGVSPSSRCYSWLGLFHILAAADSPDQTHVPFSSVICPFHIHTVPFNIVKFVPVLPYIRTSVNSHFLSSLLFSPHSLEVNTTFPCLYRKVLNLESPSKYVLVVAKETITYCNKRINKDLWFALQSKLPPSCHSDPNQNQRI